MERLIMPINVNMTKARAIHLAEIRRVRNEELAKEDGSTGKKT